MFLLDGKVTAQVQLQAHIPVAHRQEIEAERREQKRLEEEKRLKMLEAKRQKELEWARRQEELEKARKEKVSQFQYWSAAVSQNFKAVEIKISIIRIYKL